MKIRAFIVDDDPVERKRLRLFLKSAHDIEVSAECGNGFEALRAQEKQSPDLIFLDVQMPELDGFGFLQRLPPDDLPTVIFMTAYDDFALKAFEVHKLHYLLKPISALRFQKSLQTIRSLLSGAGFPELKDRLVRFLKVLPQERQSLSHLTVQVGKRKIFLKPGQIDWLEVEGKGVLLHVGSKSYSFQVNISDLLKDLDPDQFVPIRHSILVNLDAVKAFHPSLKGEAVVVLNDGTRLKASRLSSQRKRLR